jgi:hypothetical protein
VLSVDDRTIGPGGIGPITARIVAAYHEVVRSQGTPIAAAAPQPEALSATESESTQRTPKTGNRPPITKAIHG